MACKFLNDNSKLSAKALAKWWNTDHPDRKITPRTIRKARQGRLPAIERLNEATA